MRDGLLVLVEARDVGRLQVDLRLALDHPLGHRAADPGPSLTQTAAADHSPRDLGRLAQDRQPVRRQREQAVDRVLDAHRLVAHDLRHQLERVLHLLHEVVLGEGELGRRERRLLDRGDLVGVVQDRAVGVRADLEAAAVLALVHVRVHVAHDRELDRALGVGEARHRADVDHLVHRGRERDRGAGHARQARAPDAAGDHDDVGLDVAARGAHALDAAALDVDAEHLGVGGHRQRAGVAASSRISVPARSESTTPTPGE